MGEREPLRIALVEDDPSMASAIVRMLRLMGMAAEHFRSAEHLLSAGGAGHHCYVVDIHLPGLSGLDLQRKLRSLPTPTPVILITGDDDPDLQLDATQAGAAAVLIKPFTGRALADTVRRIASR